VPWPITADAVAAHAGSPVRDADRAALERATAAAVAWVNRHVPLPPGGPDPDVELGTILLAARWYARRASPAGFAGFADFGPAYVRSSDPDVARLLGLGRPVVG
jgi:hypothetical protein